MVLKYEIIFFGKELFYIFKQIHLFLSLPRILLFNEINGINRLGLSRRFKSLIGLLHVGVTCFHWFLLGFVSFNLVLYVFISNWEVQSTMDV